MAAWLTYLRERFPLGAYALSSGGLAATGGVVGRGRIDVIPASVSFVGILMFFALLRLMDERKDLDKDRIAHPSRPLPRGLLDVRQVEHVIGGAAGLMLAWALVSMAATSLVAGAAYLVVTAYLWLMYREFYIGTWLGPRPVLYALTHQLVLIPLSAYSVFVAMPSVSAQSGAVGVSLLATGAFFAYEVCRKLDPNAHPVLETYLHVHGRARVLAMVAAAMLVAGAGARMLNVAGILWPIEILVALSVLVVWFRPAAFAIPETVAGLSLLVHLWAIPARSAVAGL